MVDELAAIDPCDLLTADELDQLELPAGILKMSDPADLPFRIEGDDEPRPWCTWDSPGIGTAKTSAALVLSSGLDNSRPLTEDFEDIRIGDRQARRSTFIMGQCRIDLAVGGDAVVIVNVLITKTPDKSCELVDAMAELIGPKLPGPA